MTIGAAPTDQNILQLARFQLSFSRLSAVTFFCTEVNLPGVSIIAPEQSTQGVPIPRAGNKLHYEPLVIKFLLDEQLLSWTSIYDWMSGLAPSQSSTQYANLKLQQPAQLQGTSPQYSDAQLMILDNMSNPLIAVNFSDLFPVDLSGIDFSTGVSAEIPPTATAQFKYTNYSYTRDV